MLSVHHDNHASWVKSQGLNTSLAALPSPPRIRRPRFLSGGVAPGICIPGRAAGGPGVNGAALKEGSGALPNLGTGARPGHCVGSTGTKGSTSTAAAGPTLIPFPEGRTFRSSWATRSWEKVGSLSFSLRTFRWISSAVCLRQLTDGVGVGFTTGSPSLRRIIMRSIPDMGLADSIVGGVSGRPSSLRRRRRKSSNDSPGRGPFQVPSVVMG